MSSHASSRERSILWLIVPVAFGLTLMFAMVNRSLNVGDRQEVSAGERVGFGVQPASTPAHGEDHMKAMPSESAHADTTHSGAADTMAADTLTHH